MPVGVECTGGGPSSFLPKVKVSPAARPWATSPRHKTIVWRTDGLCFRDPWEPCDPTPIGPGLCVRRGQRVNGHDRFGATLRAPVAHRRVVGRPPLEGAKVGGLYQHEARQAPELVLALGAP